jgi:hypothetical protein
MLMYVMSITVLGSPFLGYWVLMARYSRRTKVIIATVGGALLLLAPFAAMWLFGGNGPQINIPLD